LASRVPKIIEKIRFGLLSPDEIRKLSVTRIITADTYDEDGLPIDSGLMDSRLGTVEPGRRCKTCGNRVGDCPGHFGHIELARPVIHVGFNKLTYKALRSTCRKCSRILMADAELEKLRTEMDEHEKTWNELNPDITDKIVKHAIRVSQCPHCGETQRKIGFEKPTSFTEETEAGPVRLTSSDVRDRLERITDEDQKLLGINSRSARLEWTVLTVLPVPPIAVRPSITLESGVRSEDDLTHKLVDVVRINQRLKENIDAGAPQLIVEDLWELLQYHVTTYFDNEVSGVPPARHRSGRALRTLAQRLKGKEGRFRSNLSGKRVDFSARTVISPDPNISINDVGVPLEVAKILTIPERVTNWNIEETKKLVRNGPAGHPGANYVIRMDGRRVDLRFVKDLDSIGDAIEPGSVVERHLKDGDIVLFNRQPSLHRMSIMAHEVRVMPYKTFRLNLCVCPPYNADFDGDEMNLHVPQSEEARAEAKTLMRVQEQILSPRYGGPIIGGIQDYISAGYLLTKKGSYLTLKEMCGLIDAAGINKGLPEPELKNPDMWSGKQIISMLLPDDLSYSWKAKICHKCEDCKREECTYDAYCIVKNGKLISGVFDKNAFGAGVPESIYHYMIKSYGNDAARVFLDSITRLLVMFITVKGFTMGIDDVRLREEATNRIREILDDGAREVDQDIEAYRRGEMEPVPGHSVKETLEMRLMQHLSEARDGAGDIADKYLGMGNYAVIMARSGARGDRLNLAQMAACVGQQSVRGERIMRGYQQRSLPHFKPEDLSSEARGFVSSSYYTGLTPIEFFFHAMGGREGLVDTAVRTSTSGYMQRRLINALQDIKVEYDGTVRTSVGRIVQFQYGEDGIDPSKSYHGHAINLDAILKKNLGEKFKK